MNRVYLGVTMAMLMATSALATSPPSQAQAQLQGQAQIQAQGQLQGQAQSSKNINRNSARSSSSAKQSSSQANQQITNQVRPSGIAPSIGLGGFASGPCVGVTTQGGIGIGLPGGASFGAGGGKSEMDDECTAREWFRLLSATGHHELAAEVLGQSALIQRLRAARKQADAAPAAVAAPAPSDGFCFFNPKDAYCKP